MFSQSDDAQPGVALGLVAAIVVATVCLVVGMGVARRAAPPVLSAPAPVLPATPAPEPAPLPAVSAASSSPARLQAQAAADAASITVEYGVVKFYFASGKADLAAGAGDVLVDVVRGARSGKQVVISGFHDARGNAQANAELARRRAFAVRDALRAAGVADSQMRLEKPAQATSGESDAEARRVEIALQ